MYYQQNLTGQEPEMSITYGSVEYMNLRYEVGYNSTSNDIGSNIQVISIYQAYSPYTQVNIDSAIGKKIAREFRLTRWRTIAKHQSEKCDEDGYDDAGFPVTWRAKQRENHKRR